MSIGYRKLQKNEEMFFHSNHKSATTHKQPHIIHVVVFNNFSSKTDFFFVIDGLEQRVALQRC